MSKLEETEAGPIVDQRRILLGFCATVLIGVILCAAYLGRRATAKPLAVAVQAHAVLPERKPPEPAPQPAPQVQPAVTMPVVSRPEKHTTGDTYLQIAAVDRGMAGVLLEVLQRKGFQAEIANGPTDDIFRVMVGPAKDAATLTRIKADLQAAGFTSFARKAPKLVAAQHE